MFISTCSIKSYLRFGSGADPTAFGGKRLWRLPSKRSEVQNVEKYVFDHKYGISTSHLEKWSI